jgi:hypothetical protein
MTPGTGEWNLSQETKHGQRRKKKTMEEELRLYEERIYALYRQAVDF